MEINDPPKWRNRLLEALENRCPAISPWELKTIGLLTTVMLGVFLIFLGGWIFAQPPIAIFLSHPSSHDLIVSNNPKGSSDYLALVISITTLILTILAIFVAVKINESVQASECTKIYFSKEMLKSIRILFNLREKLYNRIKFENPNIELKTRTPENNAEVSLLLCPKEEKLIWTEEEDNARRLVKSYFLLIYELRHKRIIPISKYMLKRLCDVDALPLYFEVIEPMEKILNNGYDTEPFYCLMKDVRDLYDEKRQRHPKAEIKNKKFLSQATADFIDWKSSQSMGTTPNTRGTEP